MAVERIYSEIGERVRKRRIASGLTQAELGALANMERALVANVEAGRQRLHVHDLAALAGALGVSVGWLAGPAPAAVPISRIGERGAHRRRRSARASSPTPLGLAHAPGGAL